MDEVTPDPTVASDAASGDPVALAVSIAAVVISLLAVIVPFATGMLQRRRDDRAKRSEMYLELMEFVEKHGLWVVDKTFDLTEDNLFYDLPRRNTEKPGRGERVRARAIVSSYASTAVSNSFSEWLETLEAFEGKLDELSLLSRESGTDSVDEAKPCCKAESKARKRLADLVNAELVNDRRWRRQSLTNVQSVIPPFLHR